MSRSRAPLAPTLLEAATALVRRRIGLAFTGPRASALEQGLLRAMSAAGLSDPAMYLARLDGETDLLDALVAEITVGETYFFRDRGQWNLLRTQLLPQLLERRSPDYPLRVWSAGCASGEEPYTAAIVLHQLGGLSQTQILGTDLSRPALAAARGGRYSRWSLRDVPDEIARLYFRRAGSRFDLTPSIRETVEFRYLNLAEDAYPSLSAGLAALDLILCRNVLIYFDADTVARVARLLLESLSEDGRLLLGASDPLLTGIASCELEVTGAGLVYRRSRRRPSVLASVATGPLEGVQPRAQARAAPLSIRRPKPSLTPLPPSPLPPAPASLPDNAAAEAKHRYSVRDYNGAAELAAALLERGERDPGLSVLLVRALANRGDLTAAGRACATALDLHRTCAELVFLHGVLLMQSGRHAESVAALRRALYLDRALVVAHLALGGLLPRLGDTSGARRAFRNAERLLATIPPAEPVPASDGEPAARLLEIARAQLGLLDQPAA